MRALGALALLLPAFATAQIGPLEIRNARFLNLPFLRPTPRGPVLLPGEREWAARLSLVNDVRSAYDFSGNLRVREDAETEILNLTYRQGIGRGLDFTFDLPLYTRGGGILDGFLDGYHDLLGLSNTTRSGVPYGRSDVIVNGQRFGSASGVGDLTTSVAYQATPRLLTRASLKLPTGRSRDLFGSGGVDASLDAIYRVPLDRHIDLWAQLGGVLQGGARDLPGARDRAYVASLTLEGRANSKDTFFGMYQSEDGALSVGAPASDGPHRVVSLGYRRKVSSNGTLEAWFMEDGDFLNYKAKWFANVGPDVVFGLGYRMKF